jgi:hypothetical protein
MASDTDEDLEARRFWTNPRRQWTCRNEREILKPRGRGGAPQPCRLPMNSVAEIQKSGEQFVKSGAKFRGGKGRGKHRRGRGK